MTTDIVQQATDAARAQEAILAQHELINAVGDDPDSQELMKKIAPALINVATAQARRAAEVAESKATSATADLEAMKAELNSIKTSRDADAQSKAFTALEMAMPDDVPEVSAMIRDDKFIAAYEATYGDTPFTVKQAAAAFIEAGQPKKAAKLIADTYRSVNPKDKPSDAMPKSVPSSTKPALEVAWKQNPEFHKKRATQGFIDI
jgi:hypothetical protein